MQIRDIEPPLYNAKRLKEKPLPNIEREENSDQKTSKNNADRNENLNDSVQSVDAVHDNREIEIQDENPNDSVGTYIENANAEENCNDLNAPTRITEISNDSNFGNYSYDGSDIDSDENRSTLQQSESIHSPQNDQTQLEPALEEIFFQANSSCDSFATITEQTEGEVSNDLEESSVDPIKTEPMILLEPFQSNNDILEDLLEGESDVEDVFDEEITFLVNKKKGYGKPFNSTTHGLIKRKDDEVTGDIPFIETVGITSCI